MGRRRTSAGARARSRCGRLALALAWAPGVAPAGTIETADGRVFQGRVTLLPGAVLQVRPTGPAGAAEQTKAEPIDVPWAQVRAARFDPATDRLKLATAKAPADGHAPGTGTGFGLLGVYYDNVDFSGKALARIDPAVNFDWGLGAPIPGIGKDYFSVRWSGYLEVPRAGIYSFFTSTDDGVRLAVGDTYRREMWSRGEDNRTSGSVWLEPGLHRLTFDYCDNHQGARAQLLWSGPGVRRAPVPPDRLHPARPTGQGVNGPAEVFDARQGLLGTYYPSPNFRGVPQCRIDPGVAVEPGQVTVEVGGEVCRSACWSGHLKLAREEGRGGSYRFFLEASEIGGAILWLDDKQVASARGRDDDGLGRAVELEAGRVYNLWLEAYNDTGPVAARLSWSGPGIAGRPPVPPEVLSPVTPAPERPPAVETAPARSPAGDGTRAAGVYLRDGGFLDVAILSADRSALRVAYGGKALPISAIHLAQIVFRRLSHVQAQRLTAGRPGVLLASGDFVEGDLVRSDGGTVEISSLLLGNRRFRVVEEALAVVLHPPSPQRGELFLYRSRDGHRFIAPGGRLTGDVLALRVPFLPKPLRLQLEDLAGFAPGDGVNRTE